MSFIERNLLRLWARTDVAPGYQYVMTEKLAPRKSRRFSTRLPNGCTVSCDLSEHVDRHIYFHGAYEPIESYLFCSLLKPGMTVIDAGANIGQYTLLGSTSVGASGKVHSFEPIPANFARLSQHVASNGLKNVKLNQKALWSSSGKLSAGLPGPSSGNSGLYSIQERGELKVEAITLDEYARDLSRLDMIKMDVEGAEPHVLKGGQETLRRFRPWILMEVNRPALLAAKTDLETLWSGLSALGYKAWKVGFSSADSGDVTDFSSFQQSNIIAHVGDLPAGVTDGWDLRTALKWARQRW